MIHITLDLYMLAELEASDGERHGFAKLKARTKFSRSASCYHNVVIVINNITLAWFHLNVTS